MRRSLYFSDAKMVIVKDEEVPIPERGKVLVKTEMSGLSAGTELLFYRGLIKEGTPLDGTIPR